MPPYLCALGYKALLEELAMIRMRIRSVVSYTMPRPNIEVAKLTARKASGILLQAEDSSILLRSRWMLRVQQRCRPKNTIGCSVELAVQCW